MLFIFLRIFWPYHLNVAAEIETLQTRQRFSNLLLSHFGESVWVASVPVLSWQEPAPGVVFCCVVHLLQGSTCCAFKRWYSVYLGSTRWFWTSVFYGVTVAFLSSLTSLPILLWHQQGIFIHSTAAHRIFLFFGPFSVNLEMVVCENPSRSADSEILRPVRLTPTTIPRSSHLNPLSSPFWCSVWTSASRLHHI